MASHTAVRRIEAATHPIPALIPPTVIRLVPPPIQRTIIRRGTGLTEGDGPSSPGPSVLGRNVLGRNVLGRNVLGPSVFGRNVLGPSVFGRNVLGPSVLGRNVLSASGPGPSGPGRRGRPGARTRRDSARTRRSFSPRR